jgi:beta-ribofuranosylaminobenzene 5'-phosphate synthase
MDFLEAFHVIEERTGRLSSVQKILLSTDGSVTSLLEAVIGRRVAIETHDQRVIPADEAIALRLAIETGAQVNYREVAILDEESREVLIRATSYAPLSRLPPGVRADLLMADIPIGKILSRHKVEARREVSSITTTRAGEDASSRFRISRNEPLLNRSYLILHGGEPLLAIDEEFPYAHFIDQPHVMVEAPSRIHITLLDMHGGLSRVDGGIGIALNNPCVVIEAYPSEAVVVNGGEEWARNIVLSVADRVLAHISPGKGVGIRIHSLYAQHCGLGSGTQLALATARAITELCGETRSVPELAQISGRGGTSGIGTWAFAYGGFIIDGGHEFGAGKKKTMFSPSSSSSGVAPAPLIFRQPFPPDWRIALAIPAMQTGASGSQEQEIFSSHCPVPERDVGAICREVMVRMLPGIVEHDLDLFGSAVNAIQELGFKQVEISLRPPGIRALLTAMREAGAACAGMSSFGPSLYAIGDTNMQEVCRAAEEYMGQDTGGTVLLTSASNTGATVRSR